MPGLPWRAEEDAVLYREYPKGTRVEEIVAMLPGRGPDALKLRARKIGLTWGTNPGGDRPRFVQQPVPANRSLDDIFADQAERHKAKREHHEVKRGGLTVELDGSGPYGILFFGDPHADDDGCDLEYLAYCMDLVRQTPNLYAANLGDLTNNWVGKLAGLYAHQHTTDDEAALLIEWLVQSLPWLFVILGNHDKWGLLAERICRENETPYVSHGAKFKVKRGEDELVIDARHDHSGRSMYNPAHGQGKRNYRGSDADIIIGGHIHTSGYQLVKNGITGKIGHCLRLSSFKRVDEYADRNDFDDGAISPAVMAVIQPGASQEGYVTIFHDPDMGIKFLEAVRA